MGRVSTYLNFPGTAEEAFTFYKSVFGTEFEGGIARMGDGPTQEGQPAMSEADKRLVMNVALPILGGHLLMASDTPASMGVPPLNQGNNVSICLEPDSRAEADRLFAALGQGGTVTDPLQEAFWGDYFGALTDRFGVQWLVNCTAKA